MQRSLRWKHGSVQAPRCAALWLQCLTTIATDLELQKANKNGKVLYGALSQIAAEYKESFLWLNKEMVQNHIRKLNSLIVDRASIKDS